MKKVGLLFDSINNNIGDMAIGIVMEEFCKSRKINYEVVNPFNYDESNYDVMLIGGGHLLRDPGDPFYDNFRVQGKHILNAMGVSTSKDVEYLNDYKYVSVRSERERKLLGDKVKNVNVVPCTSVMMRGEGYHNKSTGSNRSSVGVHLVSETFMRCPGVEDVINQIKEKKVFIPFTHYNQDKSLMQNIDWEGDHCVLEELSPKQLYDVIGDMKFVIVSSLHATIFAYIQNIPFLTLYQEKVFDFLKDRELEKWIFKDSEELANKIRIIDNEKVDFTKLIQADKMATDNHLNKIEDIINNLAGHKEKSSDKPKKPSEIDMLHMKYFLLEEAINGRDRLLGRKFEEIEIVKKGLTHRDNLLQINKEKNVELEEIVHKKNLEIVAMQNSKFWKLRNVYVRFGPRRVARIPRRVIRVLRRDGIRMFIKKIGYLVYFKGHIPQQYPEYQQWIKNNEKVTAKDAKIEIENFKYKPKISVIVPVYNVEPKWLNKAIESVRGQYYENWELCLYDDASTKKVTIDCLKHWQTNGDSRIKVGFGKKNQHISGASNEALKMATGEFVALLDNDDEVAPFALYENVKLMNEHKDADFIYSDEDKMDSQGKRSDPFFKPVWSPELMLSQMYTCHLGVYRKSIIDKIGGFRKGYEGAQDYDLVLRFVEHTKPENIFHIPKVLYHWRAIETSTAMGASAKDYAHGAAKKALQDYLKRNKLSGEVLDGPVPGTHRVKVEVEGNPLVSIIIPFRDHVEVLKTCVDSIIEKTDYDNYEIILVDNQSEKKETKEYLKELESNPRVKVLKYNKPFCYSAINNYAVDKAVGEYVLLLNNDTEVITGEWLRAMLEQAQKKKVGAVGAKLLYPNDRIQHAGIIMGMGIAGHAFKSFKDGEPNYFKHADIIKNYSGVTAACLMTKKSIYEEIGGLNEKELKIAYNDVDFCLRVLETGYRIVYTPYAKLYHYESLSRGDDHELKKTNPKEYKRVVAEIDYMDKKWDKYIKNDPYYSPNLTRKHENFGINTDFSK